MLTFNWYDVSREEIQLGDIRWVELYCFNIGGELFSAWEKYPSVKLYLVLSYTFFNIGGGLFSAWEKYTSVKLYLC